MKPSPQKSQKRAPECIKMHHFEGENAKIFLPRPHPLGRGIPPPTPVDAFGASIRVPSALDPQTTFLHTGLGPGPQIFFPRTALSASIWQETEQLGDPSCRHHSSSTFRNEKEPRQGRARQLEQASFQSAPATLDSPALPPLSKHNAIYWRFLRPVTLTLDLFN